MKRQKAPPENTIPLPPCAAEGCLCPGEYPAPRHKKNPAREYHYFCLEHVREFNKTYNFFTGMDDDAVQAFMKDAVTGHRPTWRLGSDHALNEGDLQESINRLFGDPLPSAHPPVPSLSLALRQALEAFTLTHPTTGAEVKKSYKRLAKTWHPDVNKNAGAVEKFKEITEAYQLLMEHYPSIR